MKELWQTLSVGDAVRIRSWPSSEPREEMDADLAKFYQFLIDTGAILKIVEIDECGLPWAEYWHSDDEVESITINHDGLEVVHRNTL